MSPPEGPRDHAPAAEWVHVSDLHPWPGNYNDHGPEQLEALHAAIDRRGWGAPILAHRGTGQVVDGHGRLEVARAKIADDPTWQLPDAPGPGQVPVRWRDGTWEECEEEALAANLIPRLSRIDDRRMGQVLAAVSSRNGGVSEVVARSVGLDRERVAGLLHRARPKDPSTTPPPPELPRSGSTSTSSTPGPATTTTTGPSSSRRFTPRSTAAGGERRSSPTVGRGRWWTGTAAWRSHARRSPTTPPGSSPTPPALGRCP